MPKFTWDVDPIITTIGGFPLRWYSLLFVGVFLGGYALLNWQIRRGGGDEEEAGDFIVYGVLGVLLGARLGHVLFYDLDKALADPLWIFKIWTGGLASHGAVVGLAVAMYVFCKRRRIPFLEGADRFTFSGALGATLVRIGNFFNSEIVGKKTDQSWGVRFPRYDEDPINYRIPTQLFEAAIGIFVLVALIIFDRALGKEKRPRGALISFWFALYFPLRFIVEFYKEPQVFLGGRFDMGQYLSIPGALLGFFGLYWAFKRRIPAGWYEEYDEKRERKSKLRDPDVDAELARPRKKKKKGSKKAKKKAAPVAAPSDVGESNNVTAPESEKPAAAERDSEPGARELEPQPK